MSAQTTRRRRWRVLLALGLGYALVEAVALPLVAARAPLSVRVHLPSQLFLLSQRTKRGLVPRDWTLILGDSYAQGYGDWLLDALASGAPEPAYHAGHVLHERTGDDVLSFGRGGAGSMKALTYLFAKSSTALWRLGLGRPQRVLVFVYEGNDFTDNLAEVARYGGLHPGDDPRDLDALCYARARVGTWAGLAGTFFFPGFLANKCSGRQGLRTDAAGTALVPADEALPERNLVQVGDRLLHFRGPVQSPPIGLDPAQLDWSLATLEAALAWLRERLSGVPLTLVYLPSPAVCYPPASRAFDTVQSGGPVRCAAPEDLVALHTDLVQRTRAAAERMGYAFLDATPRLRAVARRTPIHGPTDAAHFNRAGYETLGALLAASLPEQAP